MQQHLKILADVNIIPAVVKQLRLRGVEADRLIDLLPQDTKDPDIYNLLMTISIR